MCFTRQPQNIHMPHIKTRASAKIRWKTTKNVLHLSDLFQQIWESVPKLKAFLCNLLYSVGIEKLTDIYKLIGWVWVG